MNKNWELLCSSVPQPPRWEIKWDIIMNTPLASYLDKLKEIQQNPVWHGEGDVFTHTKMVCEQLVQDKSFQEFSKEKRDILFISALLHDIGKIPCSRLDDDKWISPNHTIVGSKMARKILWTDFSLAGTEEDRDIRESICTLIRYHSVPVHILDQNDPKTRLLQIAAQGELIPSFSLLLLFTLVRADLNGRICSEAYESLEMLDLSISLAKEDDILIRPFNFPSPKTRYMFLNGKHIWKNQDFYDDTWGEVILMSGLPGTGKDTWIKNHYPDMPVISLDVIRKEMNISPSGKQGKVIHAAREQAKAYLRKKQPFVWNATSLTKTIRQNQETLFSQYSARTRIVFLETAYKKCLERNAGRREEVPEHVISDMLKKIEPPALTEAIAVEWHCV